MKKIKTIKTVSKKVPPTSVSIKDYAQTLLDLKKQVAQAQIKATLSANKELITLYWNIGKTIVEKQKNSGWGSSVIERLSKDLQNAFPGIGGFSRANIFRMQAFYGAYEKVAQPVRQIEVFPIFNIPWGHNVCLLQKLKKNEERASGMLKGRLSMDGAVRYWKCKLNHRFISGKAKLLPIFPKLCQRHILTWFNNH